MANEHDRQADEHGSQLPAGAGSVSSGSESVSETSSDSGGLEPSVPFDELKRLVVERVEAVRGSLLQMIEQASTEAAERAAAEREAMEKAAAEHAAAEREAQEKAAAEREAAVREEAEREAERRATAARAEAEEAAAQREARLREEAEREASLRKEAEREAAERVAAARAEQSVATAESLPRLLAAVARLDAAENQAEVLARLLEECTSFASRAALLLVGEGDAERLEVWNATGFGGELAGRELAYPDALKELTSRPIVNTEAAVEVCESFEAPAPLAAVLLPFVLRDDMRAVLYADRLDAAHAFDPAAVQLLCFIGAQIIETLPLRKRRPAATLATVAGETAAADAATLVRNVVAPVPPAAAEAAAEGAAEVVEEAEPAAGEAALPVRETVAEVPEAPAGQALAEEPPPETAEIPPSAIHPPEAAAPTSPESQRAETLDESLIPPSERRTETLAKPSFTPPSFLEDEKPVERPDVDALDALAELEGDSEEVGAAGTVSFPSEQWDSGAISVGEDSVSLEVSPEELAGLSRPAMGAEQQGGETSKAGTVEVALPEEPDDTRARKSGAWQLDAEATAAPGAREGSPPPPPEAGSQDAGEAGWTVTPKSGPAPSPPTEKVEASPFAGLTPGAETTRSPFEDLGRTETPPPPAAPERAGAPPLPPTPPPAAPKEATTPATPATPPPITKELGGEVRPPVDASVGPGLAFQPGSSAEEELHAEAKRLARLLVSELKLYNEEEIEEGKRNGNIYRYLKEAIERSRVMYEERIDERVRTAADYFYDELVRSVAGGDAKLLGI